MNLTSENLLQMAGRPDGVCVQDMLKEHRAKAGRVLEDLFVDRATQKLWKLKVSHKSVRFFASQELLDAYVKAHAYVCAIETVQRSASERNVWVVTGSGCEPTVRMAESLEKRRIPNPNAKVVVPKGVTVTKCPAQAYEPCPADRPIPVRPGAMHYVGRNSI